MLQEQWKPIEGWPKYMVSDQGRVWSRKSGKILRPQALTKGYMGVSLYREGTGRSGKTHKVHRLVALTFIENPAQLPEVNHKDGDKTHNWVRNLEWTTNAQNFAHAEKIGLRDNLRGQGVHFAVLSESQAREVCRRLREGEYIKSIARDIGIAYYNVACIARGETWRHISGGPIKYRRQQARGSDIRQSRFTEYQVIDIKKQLREGVTAYRIAKNMGCHHDLIGKIKRGNTWGWLGA